MLKKKLSFVLIVSLVLSLSIVGVYAGNTQNNAVLDGENIIGVDMDDISLDQSEKKEDSEFKEGLIEELKSESEGNELTVDDLKEANEELEVIVSNYCKDNKDVISEKIYDEIPNDDLNSSTPILLHVDEDSEGYSEYTETYSVNENMNITFTPDEILIDEYVEENNPVVKNDEASMISSMKRIFIDEVHAASWKYKSVATRRTLIKKVTFKNKTYSFSIMSAHTGGQVKYNKEKARHSADYYAYSQSQKYGATFSFKKVSKLREAYSGTSYHYKYAGKVTGKIKVTTPVNVTITYSEQLLGCQVIVNKNGKVTKKYWPAL